MDRWQSKIAVVTGASAGIGAATCKALVERRMIVVGLARRLEKMEEKVRPLIVEKYRQNFYTLTCDVRDEKSVINAFAWIVQTFGGVDVLVNNAGMMKSTTITGEDNSEIMRDTVNTNILGIVWCTREAFRSMKQRNFAGHVINIGSYAGHVVPHTPGFSLNIYAPTKHAVKAMTEVLRQEFLQKETKIKVTSISPGGVRTEFLGENVELPPDWSALSSADIADAIVCALQTPPHVQIHDMIIKAVGEVM